MFCLGKWSANGGFHIELLGYQRAYHFSEPLWSCPRLTFPISQKGSKICAPEPKLSSWISKHAWCELSQRDEKAGGQQENYPSCGVKTSLSLLKLPICWDSIPIFDIPKWSDDLLFFVKMDLLAIFCISNHPNFFGVRILSHTQQQKRKRRWKSRSASRTYTVTCLSCLGPLRRVRATQNCVDAVHLRAGAIPFVDLHEQGIEKQFLWPNQLWPTRSIRSPSVGQLADRCTPWWF